MGSACMLGSGGARFWALGAKPAARAKQQTSVLSQQKTLQLPAGGRQPSCLLLRQDRCLLLRQDRCLLLRQDRCLLLRQDRCLLLQEQTSVLSQHTMLMSRKSQLSQYHTVQVSETSIVGSQKSQLWQYHNVQVADRRSGPKSAKMARNGSRMVARSKESTPGFLKAIFSPLGPVPRPKTAKI